MSMTIETKLASLPLDGALWDVTAYTLWVQPEGWAVFTGFTIGQAMDKGEVIAILRSRWEVFKLNYLPKARVEDLTDSSREDDIIDLEVDCTAFASIRRVKQ